MRRLKISFLEEEFTQILAKDYIASLLLLTVLCFAVNEDKNILLSRKNEIYILKINLQLFFHRNDIINTRLLKN